MSCDPFLLDPEIVFLNHGSFGACPRPVFDVYQEWQREFERDPVDLFERRLEEELAGVCSTLGEYVGAPAGDLALILNATFGVKFQNGRYAASVKATNLGNQPIQQHIFGDVIKRQVVGEFRISLK